MRVTHAREHDGTAKQPPNQEKKPCPPQPLPPTPLRSRSPFPPSSRSRSPRPISRAAAAKATPPSTPSAASRWTSPTAALPRSRDRRSSSPTSRPATSTPPPVGEVLELLRSSVDELRPDDRDGHARPARRHDGRPDPVHRRRTDRQGRALQYE